MRFAVILMLLLGQPSDRALIHVVRADPTEIVAEPVITPRLTFRLEEGTPPETGIHSCRQSTEYKELAGVRYPALVLRCDGGLVLVLTGLDLTVK